MAAFCACCGAVIGPKAEACTACGAPAHGMIPKGQRVKLGVPTDGTQDEEKPGGACRLL